MHLTPVQISRDGLPEIHDIAEVAADPEDLNDVVPWRYHEHDYDKHGICACTSHSSGLEQDALATRWRHGEDGKSRSSGAETTE